MTIRLIGFQGEFPMISPRLLPDNAAQVAQNVRLEDGALIPLKDMSAEYTFGSSMASFHYTGAAWLGWAASGVKAAPGPIADDRLYVFGDGAPKLVYSGTTYPLALAAPTVALTAALEPSTEPLLIGHSGSNLRMEYDGINWTIEDVVVDASFTLSQTVAPVGETTVALSDDVTDRTVIALLPVSPSSGTIVALVQQGTGRVVIHRNGETIDGAEVDSALSSDTAAAAAIFFGGSWSIRGIGKAFQTITATTTVGSGQHVAVNSAAAVTLTLPASPSAGDIVSAYRNGAGTVTFAGSGANINGAATFAIPTVADRYVVMFNGTEWKALKIEGAYDANYLSISANTVLANVTAYRVQVDSAPRSLSVELPTGAASGEIVKVGRVGGKTVWVLPNGDNIDAAGLPIKLAADGEFRSFTFSGAGWTSAVITEHVAIDRAGTAASDTTIFAVANRRDYEVQLPAAPTTGDYVEIHVYGGYQVSANPNGGAISREANEDTAEDVLFAFTWVTSLDEESPPSPLSARLLWSTDIPVKLTGFPAVPAGRLINRVRVYRSQTSASGLTDLYFVAELAAPLTDWVFSDDANPIVEIIPSNDYDPPVAGLSGIVALPNGIMAAFTGRRLMFSEPYHPHAWPTKYQLTTDYPIVGLAAFGSILAVMTTGTPYVVQGTQPDTMAMEKIESALPCLSAEGIVDLGYAAAYPTADGLVLIRPNGAEIVTRKLFSKTQWAAMVPSTFRAGLDAGRYVFSYNDGSGRKCGIIDLTGETPFYVRCSLVIDRFHVDQRTGNLFALVSGTGVRRWDNAATLLPMLWKSKEFRRPQAISYGAMRIEAENRALVGGEVPSVKVYAAGALLHTETAYGSATRIPAALTDVWEVQIEGDLPISTLTIAETMPKLATG